MISTLLRLISTVTTAIVVASFAAFALEEADTGSKHQTQAIEGLNQPSPSASAEAKRERKHTKVREWIDDANDVLTEPFSGIVSGSGSIWVKRGVPSLLAFLLYFAVLRIIAGYATRLP
jgi:hypothetical protein